MIPRIQINILGALIVALSMSACSGENKPTSSIPQLDFEALQPLLQQNNDTIYVINFWATWCAPCVKELPDFEKINQLYSNNKVKVILVSLDFPTKLEELIIPFIEEKGIKSQVIHLTDVNANEWINKVDVNWSGAIPATLIYKGSAREFHEGSLNFDELKLIIESKI